MLKHDYGHMGCPFYEEKLENGITLVFIPTKSDLKSACIYIGQGGFLHSKEISSSKIPFGTAYYLMNMIHSPSLKEEFEKENVLSYSDLDYSYVRYFVNTLGDIYSPIERLLKRINVASYTEKDIDEFKEKEKTSLKGKSKDPIYLSKMTTLQGLYLNSPIKYGYLPSSEDGVRIHATSLKKYQDTYYVSNNIVIFVSSNDDVNTVKEKIQSIKMLSKGQMKETPFEYEEPYKEVACEYKRISTQNKHSYLTYGVKFPARAIIYDAYGEMTFLNYEVLIPSIVTENEEFLSNLISLRAELVDASLKEGGEDTVLLLTFRTEDEVSIINFLTDYFSKLDKKVTGSLLNKIEENVYINAIKDLAVPSKAVELFSRTYANHIPYTSLISRVVHLNYNSYRRFLEEFKAFKKAVCFAKRGQL